MSPFALVLSALALLQGEPIPADQPLVVTADVRVAPGRYVRPPLGDDGRLGVIRASGLRGAVIDLTGVELFGREPGRELDQATAVMTRVGIDGPDHHAPVDSGAA